jgi:hypothetical protein
MPSQDMPLTQVRGWRPIVDAMKSRKRSRSREAEDRRGEPLAGGKRLRRDRSMLFEAADQLTV